MQIQNSVSEIRDTLSSIFAEVNKWFDKPSEVLNNRPANNGWTIS